MEDTLDTLVDEWCIDDCLALGSPIRSQPVQLQGKNGLKLKRVQQLLVVSGESERKWPTVSNLQLQV